MLKRIPAAGGSVVMPRMSIGEYGFIGVFKDTEGDVVDLDRRVCRRGPRLAAGGARAF